MGHNHVYTNRKDLKWKSGRVKKTILLLETEIIFTMSLNEVMAFQAVVRTLACLYSFPRLA
jgi:hypothetical protein